MTKEEYIEQNRKRLEEKVTRSRHRTEQGEKLIREEIEQHKNDILNLRFDGLSCATIGYLANKTVIVSDDVLLSEEIVKRAEELYHESDVTEYDIAKAVVNDTMRISASPRRQVEIYEQSLAVLQKEQ